MAKQNFKQPVALSSVIASFLLTVMKLVVGLLTGSIGILSEAAHSALDFGAALITYFAVSVSDKPADQDHPYGHGKVENVSALIETGLLFLTSIWIIYEAIQRLFYKPFEVEIAWYAFVVIIISIIVDYSRARALNKVAKETKSQALEADALHFSSDILSSLVVLIGLVFVAVGIDKADAIAAIGVSIFIIRAGWVLGKRTIDVLIDKAPQGLTEEVIKITKKVNGVIGIERLRVRPVGAVVFVEMVITVSRKLTLEKAQKISKAVEKNVRKSIPETDINVRTKPLPLESETLIEQIQIIAANRNVPIHDVTVFNVKNKKYISFDLEVSADLPLKKAHKIASKLEKAIKDEIGEFEINTHIEPLKEETVSGDMINTEEEGDIKKIINKIAKEIELIKEIHDIKISKVKSKLFITLHCLFEENVSLEKVHNTVNHFEYLLKEKLPDTERVVVHTEPS